MSSQATIKRNSIYFNHESNWRSKFPTKTVLILSLIQTLCNLIILIFEIVSFATILDDNPTEVGICCALLFIITCILTFILVYKKDGSRIWATRVFIAQIFLIILIGLTGDYISKNSFLNS